MSDNNNYNDPFTDKASAGERVKEDEINVCISCEG